MFADLAGTALAVGAGDEVTELGVRLPGIVTGLTIGADKELYVLTQSRGISRVVRG